MDSPSPWSIRANLAELRGQSIAGHVDVAQPHLGVHGVGFDGGPLSGHLLALRRHSGETPWPSKLTEAYVRANDLVATYAPTDDWPFASQIYWRAGALEHERDVLDSVSLIISVQTHLLDTWPTISAGSELCCEEVLQVISNGNDSPRRNPLHDQQQLIPTDEPCCIVRRLSEAPISYAEIMPASDFRELRVQRQGETTWCTEWDAFGEFLEKGVIRRARLHGVFLPRKDDLRLAAACCNTVARCPPPLTT